jgi:uncharacterized repeat protein (TIGR02543 family)
MKRFIPLSIIVSMTGLAMMAILPGCDELVTNEIYYYDTLRIDGTNFQTDTTCGVCHNDDTDSIRIASRQWAFSGHAEGNLLNYEYLGENTSSCGPQCHTKEGFVRFLADSSVNSVYFSTEIGCFACHSPHQNRDFSLRSESNICIYCHQQTLDPPLPDLTSIVIAEDWGPHFSGELGMLLGNGGYEFDFYTYENSSHAGMQSNGCFTCHMDTASGFTLGGHSLNLSYGSEQLVEACNSASCHGSDPVINIFNYDLRQLELDDSLAVLRDSLITAGLLTTSGLPVTQTLGGVYMVSDSAGALFNYLFVNGDSSRGVHNLLYARDLINSSIKFLADQHSLTVNILPADSGTVSLNPPGGTYLDGTSVSVTATPDAGYIFESWSGDLSGNTNPTTITMDSDKTITANFTALK